MKIVKCIKCGVNNRVDSYSYNQNIYCGNCQTQLPEEVIISLQKRAIKYKYWIILGLILGGSVLINESNSTDKPSKLSGKTNNNLTTSSTNFNYPVVPVNQGIQHIFTSVRRIAPLEIATPYGEDSYYVKLVDAYTNTEVMSFFILGGQRFETLVPLGTYRIKYVTGKSWYGTNYLFGPSTIYSEADKIFDFQVYNNQINGYTIELIRQNQGNLNTKTISPNQF